MNSTRPLGGVLAPVATLFDADGDLDLDAFAANLEWYSESPLDGVVILGSNGEFASLERNEKLQLIDRATATGPVLDDASGASPRPTLARAEADHRPPSDQGCRHQPHAHATRGPRVDQRPARGGDGHAAPR